jgi:uncharacterized protein
VSELSPFPHFGPLPPGELRGREAEAGDLALRLRERRPVALLGPRRFGKTSLVRHVLWQLGQVDGSDAVWVDLYGVASLADFAVRLDHGLTAARGRLREVVDNVAAGLSVRIGVLGVELRQAGRRGPDAMAATHALLDVLVRAAERHPLILALDEFSDVAKVDGLDALLRTHLQHHYRDLGLVFAGSRPSMMRSLFASGGRAFFNQAELVELGPLTDEAVIDIVHEGFRGTDRHAGPVPMRALDVARGHPQRTMMLADAAWTRTPEGAEATDDTWASALTAVRASVDGPLSALYEELPAAQGPVLRAVARTGSAFTAAEARFHDLSKSSITAARDTLLRDGHLTTDADKRLRIVDPLLEDWLLRTFP